MKFIRKTGRLVCGLVVIFYFSTFINSDANDAPSNRSES